MLVPQRATIYIFISFKASDFYFIMACSCDLLNKTGCCLKIFANVIVVIYSNMRNINHMLK